MNLRIIFCQPDSNKNNFYQIDINKIHIKYKNFNLYDGAFMYYASQNLYNNKLPRYEVKIHDLIIMEVPFQSSFKLYLYNKIHDKLNYFIPNWRMLNPKISNKFQIFCDTEPKDVATFMKTNNELINKILEFNEDANILWYNNKLLIIIPDMKIDSDSFRECINLFDEFNRRYSCI